MDWPQILNLDPESPSWLKLLNLTLEEFVNLAMWDRCVHRYAICVNEACITWPRQFMGIEAMDVCDYPVQLRNRWHEYLEAGPGRAGVGRCAYNNSYDRGRGFVMFDDITIPSRIRLYPQNAADIGKTVTIRGFNASGQEVLTNGGQTVGEKIVLAMPFVDSTTIWARQVFREVIKEVTRAHVLAYSYDYALPVPPASPGLLDTPLKALADWEPTETLPDYRRSVVPRLDGARGCCGSGAALGDSCDKTTVTVEAKLAHIPVTSDDDFLLIGNVAALSLGMQAVMLRQVQDWVGSRLAMYGSFDPYLRKYVNGAIPLLEQELAAYQGAGTVSVIRLESSITDRAHVQSFI